MKIYQKYLKIYSEGLIGYATLSILFQSCLGSAAAMYILINGVNPMQMVQLFIVVILCMIFNGAVLSQQSAKTIFNLLLLSVFASTLLIIINALFL
ncbi:hypothetical protein [Flavobacterium litorale]|uniref:DUF3953 domain-containing protein n=1 Tax=Flavobacterium litorale TaxID=2856519 RepID=A0ABX8V609_9FLAO|nr:hypothetical protein [Flavobacterium litorale]QYJ67568.1 hypothetical protein K1I41_08375 [Flavobacterium litorale]